MAFDDFTVVFQLQTHDNLSEGETLAWINRERLKRGLKKVVSLDLKEQK